MDHTNYIEVIMKKIMDWIQSFDKKVSHQLWNTCGEPYTNKWGVALGFRFMFTTVLNLYTPFSVYLKLSIMDALTTYFSPNPQTTKYSTPQHTHTNNKEMENTHNRCIHTTLLTQPANNETFHHTTHTNNNEMENTKLLPINRNIQSTRECLTNLWTKTTTKDETNYRCL